MQKVRLGKTNLMVTKLGFGGIPIQRDSEEEAVAVVRKALELGINFIDTAAGYSNSEERIGKAIADRREELIIATKTHAMKGEEAERDLKQSLARLGTSYIDIYQFHGINDDKMLARVIAPGGPLSVAQQARTEGAVRHIGITSHSMATARAAVKTGYFETIMFPFNFITSEAADELLPLVRENDMGFIAMKPLGGGMIDNVALCIKYLLQFPDVVPIPGIEKVHEFDAVVAPALAESWQLSEDDRREMERIKKELGSSFCHRCDYCQPCSAGIPISTIMTSNSLARRLPAFRVFSGRFAEAFEKADECIDCGKCEERCPYRLPIRETMALRLAWYREAKRKYDASRAAG